jgi:threonine synthase
MGSYVSTRGGDRARLSEALFRGLARDGGLYLPEAIPRLSGPPSESPTLASVAEWVASSLMPELPGEVVRRVCEEAFDFPVPVVEVEPQLWVLELFHGPTHAFKDVGARFLARLASTLHPGGERTVLVATSGDTGGAVADAFHGVGGFRVVVLFPREGVSERQRRQMTTLGGNVVALAVDGTFDDCQRLAKAAFLDEELTRVHGLTSANSINIGRLLPQVFYYVYAAAAIGWLYPRRLVVPSGNLGNLCAGLIAARMGTPHLGFVAAANANRGFVDFLDGAPFEPRPSIPTASNAMDVGSPSNLERILALYDGDAAALRADVIGVSVTDAEAFRCAQTVYRRAGYLMDPHTAVAYEAAVRVFVGRPAPTVVLGTAHPAKFPETCDRIVGSPVPLPAGLARTLDAEEEMLPMEASLAALRQVLDNVA